MSTGTPADPVCINTTDALIASPQAVRTQMAAIDPVARLITPPDTDQTAIPDLPPSR